MEKKLLRKDCKDLKYLKRQKAILYISLHISFMNGEITKEDHQRKASRIEKAFNNVLLSWRK